MQLGLRRTTRCAAVSATAEAYGLRRRIETYASPRIKMVGGAPWGGSHPRHNAGQREQRLSVRACGSPRWAGGVETSCGGGRGWRPRRCWDPGDRCANRGRASGWDPPWPRPPPRSPLRSAASASPSTSPTSPPLPSSGPSRTTFAGGCRRAAARPPHLRALRCRLGLHSGLCRRRPQPRHRRGRGIGRGLRGGARGGQEEAGGGLQRLYLHQGA